MRISDWSSNVCASDLKRKRRKRCAAGSQGSSETASDQRRNTSFKRRTSRAGTQKSHHSGCDRPGTSEPRTGGKRQVTAKKRSEERRGGKESDSKCRSRR